MKKNILLLLLTLACTASLQAQKRTFTRDYTYQVGEADSKLTARANATTQMRNILLREVGEFLHTERTFTQNATSQDYAEKVEAITAGIVEMKTLDERWDGITYYIKAEMTVDPKDLQRRIAEVLNDKQKTKEMEEARKRTLAAEAETARLKKELEETKSEQQRLALRTKYQQTAGALSAEEYFTRGYNAQESDFNELAVEYYQQAIAIDPKNAMAFYNMGLAYHNLKNYDEAIRCYQKAVAIDKNKEEAYNNMGVAYADLKNYDEAIRYYKKAVAIDKNHAMAYNNMGLAYANLKNYDEAVRCYKKAVAIDKNYAWAYGNMGVAYDNLENYDEAIRCYKKAIAIDKSYTWAYGSMGLAYANLKDYDEAIRCFQKAVDLEPKYAWAYYNMGLAYANQENYDEAIRCYKKAVAIDPKYVWAYISMGYAYANSEDYDEAIRCFQKVIDIDPNYSWAYISMGHTYTDLKNYDEAIRCYKKAVAIDPNDSWVYSALCGEGIAISGKDRKEAIRIYDMLIEYRTSITDNKLLATIYNNKAYCLVELGDYKAALSFVNDALKIETGLAFIWDTKGEICYHLDLYEQCIQSMNKAIGITDSGWFQATGGEGHNNSYYYRGLAKIKLGQRASGYQDIKKAAENGKEEAIKYMKEHK